MGKFVIKRRIIGLNLILGCAILLVWNYNDTYGDTSGSWRFD